MRSNLRTKISFDPTIPIEFLLPGQQPAAFENIFFDAGGNDALLWIEKTTDKIAAYRTLSRSVYLKWSITMNAIEVAENRYQNDVPPDSALRTDTIRNIGGEPIKCVIAIWPSQQAAHHYGQVKHSIAAYAVSDLYGALEDIVLDLFETYYRIQPENLLKGPDYRALRQMRRDSDTSADAMKIWEDAFEERIESWRRKRGYDGLSKVFRAYFSTTGLIKPEEFEDTDIEDWCNIIELISELRNHLIHGDELASPRLLELSAELLPQLLKFVEGEPIDVKLLHLQAFECFIDQLINAINILLMEFTQRNRP